MGRYGPRAVERGPDGETGAVPGQTPRVVIIEDHPLLSQALQLALRLEGFEVVEVVDVTKRSDEEVIDAARTIGAEVALLDLFLGGGRMGTSLIGPLRALGARVLMLTSAQDGVLLAECLEAGADGIFAKHNPFDDLVGLLRDAATGVTVMQPAMREELLAELRRVRTASRELREPFERLTARQAAVLVAIIEGQAAEQIAARQNMSESTVRTHIRGILQKLGVNSQLAAVALARRAEWP